jgi:hypothetical protein
MKKDSKLERDSINVKAALYLGSIVVGYFINLAVKNVPISILIYFISTGISLLALFWFNPAPYLFRIRMVYYRWRMRTLRRKYEDIADAECNRRIKLKMYANTRKMHQKELEANALQKQLSN